MTSASNQAPQSPRRRSGGRPIVNPDRFRGWFLSDIAVAASRGGSSVRITLTSGGEDAAEVALVVEQVVHLSMDTSGSWDDFVDELRVLRLAPDEPWPEQVRHLLHHHDGRDTLTWLYLDGPGPVEVLGGGLDIGED
ncbi:hypothetical protein [Actinoplanes sp. HUAS TT8]|uniref:hypothetical protein n=1 Tax=Actinoplanes sp. HUAS TT8 TaxID=3447453 RepID=UPI003F51F942